MVEYNYGVLEVNLSEPNQLLITLKGQKNQILLE